MDKIADFLMPMILSFLGYFVVNLTIYPAILVIGLLPIYIYWFLYWKKIVTNKWLFIIPLLISLAIIVFMFIINIILRQWG